MHVYMYISSSLLLAPPSSCSSFQLEASRQLAERERLAAEAEISQLRVSPVGGRDSPFDMARSSIVLSDYKQQLEEANLRVKELESFVIEQVMCARVSVRLHVCVFVYLCVCMCACVHAYVNYISAFGTYYFIDQIFRYPLEPRECSN